MATLHSTVPELVHTAPPVRIAVIGAGFSQKVHVPAFRADNRCKIVAICASTPQSAVRAAKLADLPESYGDVHERARTNSR